MSHNLSAEEQETLERNLVWIFSDRRSGSTWLSRLLSAKAKIMDEPLIGLHLGRLEFNREGGVMTTLQVQRNRPDYFFCDKVRSVWMRDLRKLILNRVEAQFHDIRNKIVVKEPTGSQGAEILAECLPQSKLILLLRDGRDVLDSKLDGMLQGGWETEGEKRKTPLSPDERATFLERNATLWSYLTETMLQIFERRPQGSRFLLTYEDLLNETEHQIKAIYDFLGIPITPDEISTIVRVHSFANIPVEKKGRGKFYRFATPGAWRRNLSSQEKAAVERIMGPTLKKAGYAV